ncbi:MAG: glycosyltransferase family 39 protein [Bacteroidales bacterium]|nr:glycosyltransferase family 39 protein [Bacteroidales bacterium]
MKLRIFNKLKYNYSYLAVIGFAILYIFFLSNNPTSDSYSYAYSSLHGEELLRPHHLLYCWISRLFFQLFAFTHLEPMTLFQLFNAIMAASTLLVFRRIIKRVNRNENFIFSAILFCGACFGFMRFATDNEAYILPLFFSMLSIYYLQVFLAENTALRLLKMSLSIVIACLCHQLSILVYISLFIGLLLNKRGKYVLYFIVVSLIIPIVYAICCFLETNQLTLSGLFSFVLHDYVQGYAQSPELKQVLLLSVINLIRTFLQVHGNLFVLIDYFFVLFIFFFVLIFSFFVLGIVNLVKNKKHTPSLYNEKRFVIILWLILALSFLFAALSNGNAEFMILIPFILIMLYSHYFANHKAMLFIGLAFLLWNTCFALIPQKFCKFSCNEEIVEIMKTHPDATFVLIDKPASENLYLYKYSKENMPKVIYAHKYNEEEIKSKKIITDVIGAKSPLSRSSLLNTCEIDFKEYKKDSLLFNFESLGLKRELHLLQFRLK